jgi:hypothetical protein
MGRSAYFPEQVLRMRADRHEALKDFLLEAVADDGTTPFPANVLAGMRRVLQCGGLLHGVESAGAAGVLAGRR